MKNLKLFSVILMLLVGIGQMWATDAASVELCTSWSQTLAYATAYTHDYSIDDLNGGTTTMTLGVQGVYRQANANTYFQMNKKTGYFKNTTALPGKITKIETTWNVAKGATKCYFANGAEATSSDATVTVSAGTSVTYTPDNAADYYFFNIDVSTGSGSAQMTSCVVYYEKAGGDPSPSVSVTPASWDFGTVHASAEASKVFSVSGSNLTAGDLTLTVPAGFSVSPSSIAVDGTLAATNVTVSKNTSDIDDYAGDLEITGGGLASAKTVALTMTVDADPEPTGTFELFSGDIEEGDYVLVGYQTSSSKYYAMNSTVTSNQYLGITEVSIDANDQIVNPDASLVWTIEQSTNGYYIKQGSAYLDDNATSNKNYAQTVAEPTTTSEWTFAYDNTWTITNYGTETTKKTLSFNISASRVACYTGIQSGNTCFYLYKKVVNSAVTKTNPTHGEISITGAADLSSVASGTELTVTIGEVAGYRFTLKAYKTGDESTVVEIDNEGKLTMPSYPITITADEAVLYGVTLTNSGEVTGLGSFTTDKATAVATESVTLTATATENAGRFKEWSITGIELTDEQKATNPLTITMPSNAITVNATFDALYQITKSVTGGTLTCVSYAAENDLVEFTTEPNLGFGNPTITVFKTGDTETTIAVNNGKFTMQGYPVTVQIVYTADLETLDPPTLGEEVVTYKGVTLNWTGVANNEGYVLTIQQGGVDVEGFVNVAIAKDATSHTIASGLAANTAYTYSLYAKGDGEITLLVNTAANGSFTTNQYPEYTLTLSEDGHTRVFKVEENKPRLFDEISLPTSSAYTCDGKELVGWSTTSVEKTDDEPTLKKGTYQLEDEENLAETLYAVYAKAEGGGSTTTNIAYPGSSNSNMSGENDASTFGLDEEGWTIIGAKGSASNNVGLNSGDHTIRLYYNAGGSNTLTITAPQTISTVEISFVSGKANGWVKVGGETVEPEEGVYMINATSFVIGNANTSNTQVHMKNIAVNFAAETEYSEYSSTCEQQYTITLVSADNTKGTVKFSDDTTDPKSLYVDGTATIVATPAEHHLFTGWTFDSEKVTVADANSASTEITAKASDATITATFAIKDTRYVTFKVNGVAYGEPVAVYDGETVVMPANPESPEALAASYPNFIGWSATDFKKVASQPALVSGAEAITADVTYHAVFGNTLVETDDYKKITAAGELESGKNYLVVAEYGTKLEAMHGAVLTKEYWIKSGEVSETANIISSSNAEQKWQISISENVAHLYNANAEKYLALLYVSNQYYNSVLQADAADLSIAVSGEAWNISGVNNAQTIYLVHAPNYAEFIGANAASPLYLYKQVLVPTEWVTQEVASHTVTYYDNVEEEEIEVPAADVAVDGEDYEVNTTFTPQRAGYTFVGWNTDKDANVGIATIENVTAPQSLYAIWTLNHTTTLKFFAKGQAEPVASVAQTQGLLYNIPDNIVVPEFEGFVLAGWSASAVGEIEEASAYTKVTSIIPEVANADNELSFYAVYRRSVEGSGDYVKVTEALVDWSGEYLIVNEDNKVAFNGALTGTNLSGTNTTVSVSISSNTIAHTEAMDNANFTFAAVDGGYSIRSHSGYYIGRSDNSTGMNVSNEYTAAYVNTPAVGSITSSNDYLLRYNSANDQKRFRYYVGESVKGISLFRKDDYTYFYTTNPVVKYDITYLAGDAENVQGLCENTRVEAGAYTLCAAPTCEDKTFKHWSDGANTYAASAEITIGSNKTFTAIWTTKPKYTVTYDANGGIGDAPEAVEYVKDAIVTVLAENNHFTNPGFAFEGWMVTYNDGEEKVIEPDDNSQFPMPAYNVVIKAVWGTPSNQNWVLVTDVTELEAGKKYVIAAAGDKEYAMSTTQNTNNRAQTAVVKSGNQLSGTNSMQIITLEGVTGAWEFNVGGGYLYAAGSGSGKNHLKTQETNDANGKWTIAISTEDDVTIASIVATGTNTNNVLQFNNGNSKLFSCYSSASQSPVALYREKELTQITENGEDEGDVPDGNDVEIGENITWTVSSEKTVGDVFLKEGAIVNNSATLHAQNLYFKTKVGKSNQIMDVSSLDLVEDLYYDIQLCSGTLDADYWYCIAVPFDVDVHTGVFLADGTQLTFGTDYEVWIFDPQKRAQSQANGWKRANGKMEAGRAYLIGFNPGMPNTVRLKAAAGWKDHLFSGPSIPVESTTTGEVGRYDNWNGIANPTMKYIGINTDVQVFNNDTHQFDPQPYDKDDYNYVVGTPFFVQATSTSVAIEAADNAQFRAPKRGALEVEKYSNRVRIARAEAETFDNQIIVRASEEATSDYQAGHDMLTLNNTTSKTSALLWTENYGGQRLAIEEAPLVNNSAAYTLGIYAPADGDYSISADQDDASIYLTYEGRVIWDLTVAPYTLSLTKGNTAGYGLRIIAAPRATTDIDNIYDNASGVQKIMLNNSIFILRGEQMYDATGRMIK